MVKLKKKVTLRTKVTETATQNQQTTQHTNPSGSGNGKKLGVLIVLAVLAVVAFFLLKPDNSGNDVSVSSHATPNEESAPVDGEDKSDNKASDNNGNKPSTVSGQEENAQTTTVVKTQTKEATSKASQKEEVIPAGTIEEKAILVIRGDFGNGEERKMKLGTEYSTIQNKVNEMYAKGLVY